MRLYECLPVDEETPCQYVGVHPLAWHKREQPTVMFRESKYTTEMIEELLILCKEAITDEYTARGNGYGGLSTDTLNGMEAIVTKADYLGA